MIAAWTNAVSPAAGPMAPGCRGPLRRRRLPRSRPCSKESQLSVTDLRLDAPCSLRITIVTSADVWLGNNLVN